MKKPSILLKEALSKMDKLVKKGLSEREAARKITTEFNVQYKTQGGFEANYNEHSFRKKYLQFKKGAITPNPFERTPLSDSELLKEEIKKTLKKNDVYSYEELSDVLDVGVGKIKRAIEELREHGHNIKIDGGTILFGYGIDKKDPTTLNIKKMSKNTYKFGACGDNHMGSKYERMDVLNALYDEYERQGITTVFNTGNWIDGEARFNKTDIHTFGMGNQIDYFIKNYPQRKGVKTYFVSGDDHEGWYNQREGINIGQFAEFKAKDAGRNDLIHLGYMEHDTVIKAKNGETVIRTVHPGGGSSYAISYAVQKIVESYQGGEKPHILLCGHYHKAGYDYVRGVHVIQTGCFTGMTKIETDKGRKNIKDIVVGDMVLTHNNRYKKVTKLMTPRLADDFWSLNYGRKGRLDQTITATSEHPFLIERDGIRQWVCIKDVKKDDFIFILPSECSVTGEKIPYWMKMSKNANPMHLKSVRDKLSEVKGGFKKIRPEGGDGDTHLQKDILPFCEKMRAEGWQIVPVGNKVTPDAVGFKDGKVVVFELESSQGNHLEFKKTKYDRADIKNYVDEIVWINLKEKKEQPRSEYEYDEKTGCVKVRVISCKPSSLNRKQRKRETVYNFEVKDDNSYIANKVVVHNCTMDQSPFMRKKKLAAHLGGWTFEFSADDNGAITRFAQEFFPFYDNNYYKKWNYYH